MSIINDNYYHINEGVFRCLEKGSFQVLLTLIAKPGILGYCCAMEITREQYDKIADCFPRQRGNVVFDNLLVLNAILYVAEHGCKWRALPKSFGNWHSIYTRINRWSKNGVLDRIFVRLQQEQILRIKIEAVSPDSTTIKVHPDGAGA